MAIIYADVERLEGTTAGLPALIRGRADGFETDLLHRMVHIPDIGAALHWTPDEYRSSVGIEWTSPLDGYIGKWDTATGKVINSIISEASSVITVLGDIWIGYTAAPAFPNGRTRIDRNGTNDARLTMHDSCGNIVALIDYGTMTLSSLVNASIGYVKSSTLGVVSRQTGVPWGDLTSVPSSFTPSSHNLIDATGHPVSGLTAGHFLKADSSTTYSFQAHGLTKSDIGLSNVTNDAQIAKSIGTAKGDVIGFTASATPSNLGVGANGTVLMADSTTATGLKWGSVSATDQYVRVSAVDTTSGYLSAKLLAGTGVSLTASGAGNETLTAAVTGNLATLRGLADAAGWLYNNGVGVFSYSTPPLIQHALDSTTYHSLGSLTTTYFPYVLTDKLVNSLLSQSAQTITMQYAGTLNFVVDNNITLDASHAPSKLTFTASYTGMGGWTRILSDSSLLINVSAGYLELTDGTGTKVASLTAGGYVKAAAGSGLLSAQTGVPYSDLTGHGVTTGTIPKAASANGWNDSIVTQPDANTIQVGGTDLKLVKASANATITAQVTTDGNTPIIKALNDANKLLQISMTGSAVAGTYAGITAAGLAMIYTTGINALLIHQSGAYPLYLANNSTVRMTIGTDGKIAIGGGVATPDTLLTIIGANAKAGSVEQVLRMKSSDGSQPMMITFTIGNDAVAGSRYAELDVIEQGVAARTLVLGQDLKILTLAAGYVKSSAVGLLSYQVGVPYGDLTYSGLTAGHVLTATGATTAAFQAPAASTSFPSYTYWGDTLEISDGTSDWNSKTTVAIAQDAVNTSTVVRLADDTTEEAVGGFTLKIPTATNIILSFASRAVSSPSGAKQAVFKLYIREENDNAAYGSWSAGTALTAIDIPDSNVYFQYDSQTISYATLGLTAGRIYKFLLTRAPGEASDNLVGDLAVKMVKVDFS